TSGNSAFAGEVRWANAGVVFANNLADAPLHARDGGNYTGGGNYLSATAAMFTGPANADFHLVVSAATQANVIDRAAAFPAVANDFDLGVRPVGAAADVGADEYAPPVRVQSVQVDDGTAQRSRVASLTVTFSAPVTFAGTVAGPL